MLTPIGGIIVSITDHIRVRGNGEPDPSLHDIDTPMLLASLRRQRVALISGEQRQQEREEFIQRATAELQRRGIEV